MAGGARQTRKPGALKTRIRELLSTSDLSPQDIADVCSSDVRLVYAVQREMRLEAGLDQAHTLVARVAALEERVRSLEARLAESKGLPADPVSKRLVLLGRRD